MALRSSTLSPTSRPPTPLAGAPRAAAGGRGGHPVRGLPSPGPRGILGIMEMDPSSPGYIKLMYVYLVPYLARYLAPI